MIAIAFLFVRVLCDCFKSRRRLEAEILVLRHQLNVLRQRGEAQKLGIVSDTRLTGKPGHDDHDGVGQRGIRTQPQDAAEDLR